VEQSSILNSSTAPVSENSLWRFDADGQGAGSWTAYSLPSGFSRTSNALYASGNGSGYLFGGYISSRTDPGLQSLGGWPSSPGLVAYDMATNAWTNDTSCIDGSCYRVNGYLDFVPTFGSNGVLIALGGCSSNNSFFGSCKDTPSDDFTTIDVYDPSEKRWYVQTASNGPGQLPQPREGFCGVGLPGDNGTYEIFIFGGGVYSTDSTEGTTVQDYLDAVYVLSLPAFVWLKADYIPSRARTKHSCNIVGKRQMLAIGGVNPAGNIWLPADPWTQGLNVFDLTEMKWKDKYNANAEDYITPAVVKSWYKEKGMYPKWDSTEVQKIFSVNARCRSALKFRCILRRISYLRLWVTRTMLTISI
jgi:Kelch motif